MQYQSLEHGTARNGTSSTGTFTLGLLRNLRTHPLGDGTRYQWRTILLFSAALLPACRAKVEAPAPEIRPVRAITIEQRDFSVPVVLTGSIRAQDEAPLAFRIGGRMIERRVNLGDSVRPGQVVARLEPQNEQNSLRSALASLAAARGQLTNATTGLRRRESLAGHGAVSLGELDQARETFQTAQSQVEAAQAQVKFAEDQLEFTELTADAPGVITAIGAESGEVVAAGRMIVTLARQGGRDAVFDVPGKVIRSVPSDAEMVVSLKDEPKLTAVGRMREIAPQADPVTRTFQVKVGLTDPPPAMRFGATVVGQMTVDSSSAIEIPATALTSSNRQTAVWIFDPKTSTVTLRPIDVMRYEADAVIVSKGLVAGDVVVTAGVQALHPGQQVRLLSSSS